MKADTLAKQLLFCTVRVTNSPTGGGDDSVGTGFLFNASHEESGVIPLVISNKHVFRGAASIRLDFLVQNADNSGSELGHVYRHTLTPSGGINTVPYIGHPDPDVDVVD